MLPFPFWRLEAPCGLTCTALTERKFILLWVSFLSNVQDCQSCLAKVLPSAMSRAPGVSLKAYCHHLWLLEAGLGVLCQPSHRAAKTEVPGDTPPRGKVMTAA